MKKSKWGILSAALLLCLLTALPAFAQEYLSNYDVTVRINQDSSLNVTEKIEARVENISIKRGIIRSFPVEYEDKNGHTVTVGFDITDVTLDGSEVPWQSEQDGRYIHVRIGDRDRMIPRGFHTFVISYTTTRQLGFFEDHDELYWNVTGNQWTFPIERASCRVSLPGKNFGDGFSSVEWYVGAYGEKGDRSDAKLIGNNGVSTTRPLRSGEGITVVYTWPKGLVTPPPPPKTDDANAQGMVGLLTLAAVAGWFGFAWFKWGKDPAQKSTIPLFYPPNGESPAHLRYARDLKTDKTAFAATILNLAVKGALRIEEGEEEKGFFKNSPGVYTLRKMSYNEKKVKLTSDEDAIMMHLFPGSQGTLTLENDNAGNFGDAMDSLSRHMGLLRKQFFSSNTAKCLVGALIYFAGIAALYPFSWEYPETLMICGISGLLVIFVSLMLSNIMPNKAWKRLPLFIGRLALPLFLTFFVYAMLCEDSTGIPLAVVCFGAALLIFSVMRPLMSARTKKGYEMLAAAEGLALYMKTAEKGRLEMFNPPEETPQLFERLMPYALALDTAKTWGNRFEKLLQTEKYEPTWYVGPNPYIFMNGGGLNTFSSNFAQGLSSSMVSQTTESAPGSFSGFGGGGFSGGGGGGGGGSGW